MESNIKREYNNNIYNETLSKISKLKLTEGIVYEIFTRISNSYTNNRFKEWKSMGLKILKILYEVDSNLLYNVIKFDNKNFDVLLKDEIGIIKIYNELYTKIQKNNSF